MHRFYCPDLVNIAANSGAAADFSTDPVTVSLHTDEAHHARRVLRLNPGDAVTLFDGHGVTAEACIVDWQSGATLRVTGLRCDGVAQPRVVLGVAVPKGPRAEDMVNQLAQVGADVLIPISTERSVVDPRDKKLAKFERIAIEAAKQCGRSYLLDIEPVQPLSEVLARFADDEDETAKLIAAPGSDATDLKALVQADTVVVLVGPEGGWTDAELDSARQAGFASWCLGPHVMRIETAAVAATAILRHAALRR